jgi:hypothetical protein
VNPTVDDLLDMLLDGDPVAWEISRTPDGLRIVGLMKNGETRVIATLPILSPEVQNESLHRTI